MTGRQLDLLLKYIALRAEYVLSPSPQRKALLDEIVAELESTVEEQA